MEYFPQLSTGALAQYPLRKRITRRTIANSLPDGSVLKLADTNLVRVEWDLDFIGLSAEEASTIEHFFEDCEGDLKTFAFVDPTGNLLTWSEDLEEEVWEKDPLLLVEGGSADPLGGERGYAMRNNGGAPQGMRQTLTAPGGYWYCLSAWIRSDQSAWVTLRIGDERRHREAGPTWTRISMSAQPHGDEGIVAFGLELDAGQAMEVFGLQAEAQPGASGYKRTGSKGAVYPSSRFGQAQLMVTAHGLNSYSCRFKVISNANGI